MKNLIVKIAKEIKDAITLDSSDIVLSMAGVDTVGSEQVKKELTFNAKYGDIDLPITYVYNGTGYDISTNKKKQIIADQTKPYAIKGFIVSKLSIKIALTTSTKDMLEDGDTLNGIEIEYQQKSNSTRVNVAKVSYKLNNTLENPCYCNRDITFDEMRSIVQELRGSENKSSRRLFNKSNCPLSDTDKTYERLTEELNRTMKRYKINTCLRKIHFISQSYHETARFTTTLEGGNGEGYDIGTYKVKYNKFKRLSRREKRNMKVKDKALFYSLKSHYNLYLNRKSNGNTQEGDGKRYRGRGFMQLTWKNNYKKYKMALGVDMVMNYTYISNHLLYAVDSGGWFWENGSAWGGLNRRADNDDIYKINIAVNGGFNGFNERIVYSKKLIVLMKVNKCKNLDLKSGKELGIYKYSTSSIKGTKYGIRHKSKFKSYDD